MIKPVKDYLFSISGMVYKNKKINSVMILIAINELNIGLKLTLIFIGVFEYFYDKELFLKVKYGK